MSLLTTIDEIPLYSTAQEAIEWADRNGLNGAHPHKWENKGYNILGYMGGASHAEAVSESEDNPPPPIPSQDVTDTDTNTGIDIGGSDSGSSGGGY